MAGTLILTPVDGELRVPPVESNTPHTESRRVWFSGVGSISGLQKEREKVSTSKY